MIGEINLSLVAEMTNKRKLRHEVGFGRSLEPFVIHTIDDTCRENGISLEGQKLSLVGSSINTIGDLPPTIASQVQTLYLSNNNISSLKGIDQIEGLRSLSMANNLIRYLGQLEILGEMKVLEKLSLEGNPVSDMPFYRACVLNLCQNLVVLDGRKVTVEERKLVSCKIGKINDYFESLRRKELHNVVLHHVSKSLACTSELFEFLRPPSSDTEAQMQYFHQIANHSTATALRILLTGGVFRWLQSTGADDFDCVVQDLAATLHVQMLQELSSSEKAAMLSSPDSLYKHWRSVVEVCIRYQEDMTARLIDSCQIRKGVAKLQKDEDVEEIMRSLLQLDFGVLMSDREYEAMYRGEPTRARGGLLEGNLTRSMADRYQRILKQSAIHDDVGDGVDTSTLTISLAHSLPPQQSEPESPVVKDFDTGLRHTSSLASHWTDEITSPVRQTRSGNGNHPRHLGSPSRAGKMAMSALDSKLDFSDERVIRFMNRSLHGNYKASVDEATVLGRDIVGEWLHASASAKAMVKLDSDVGLEIRLGPSPHLNPRKVLQAKSMADLKSQVQDALFDLTVSQRECYMCWSIFEALQKQASKVRAVMSVAEEKVYSKLDLYSEILKVLNEDVNDGTRWVKSVQSLLAEVEEGRKLLSQLRESIEHVDTRRQELVDLKETEVSKKASLLSSIHEANLAIAAMSAQLYKNPNMPRKKLSKARSIMDRFEDMESRSLLLLVRIFRNFRLNIVHQRHVKVNMKRMRVRRFKNLKKSLFFRWTKLLHDSYRCRLVTLRAESSLVRSKFAQWVVAFNTGIKVRRLLSRKNEKAQRRFFRELESMHASNTKISKREKKQGVVVTCFTMVRQFRAWKRYYKKSKLPLNVEAEYNLKANTHFKRTLFFAWWQLCLDTEAELKSWHDQFVMRRHAKERERCFKDWLCQFRARNHFRFNMCVKGLIQLHVGVRRRRKTKRFIGWAIDFNSQTQLYGHRHEAFLALYFATKRKMKTRVAFEKIRFRKRRRMLLTAWSIMNAQYTRISHLGDIVSAIINRGSARILRKGFRHWAELSRRVVLEGVTPDTYFDSETVDNVPQFEVMDPQHVIDGSASPFADTESSTKTEEVSSHGNLVKYRGLLLTRKQVEMARLERIVDEDFCLVGIRYYTRNALKRTLGVWSAFVSKQGTMKANYRIVKQRNVLLLKRRSLYYMITSWLSTVVATRFELSKDLGIEALDSERSNLLLECSGFRTQILRQQERSHYLNEKLLQAGISAETAKNNLEDTNASLAILQAEHDATRQRISRLRDEIQTITIMSEGLSAPSSVREEVDHELEAMLGTGDMLRSRNAELLVGVESNYKQAVSIETKAEQEKSKIMIESHAVNEVNSHQEKELAKVEEQIQKLLKENEEAEKHISDATKSFESAIHDIKKRKESIQKQTIEVDKRKDDARDRFVRAQKEESELRIRVDELRASNLEKSMDTLSAPGNSAFAVETSVMSSLDHVTESRALLESALVEVAELGKRDELLSGDAFSRNMIDMESKRLNSFLVPEDQDNSETEEESMPSHSFRNMAADLDKINATALEFLNEDRSVRRGNRASSEPYLSGVKEPRKKRPSVSSVSTKRTISKSRPGTASVGAPAPYRGGSVSARSVTSEGPKGSAATKKAERTKRNANEVTGAEPSSEDITQQISSISKRLKERLNKEWS